MILNSKLLAGVNMIKRIYFITLIICNCTPSSVCTPTKHPHMVSIIRSMRCLSGLSGSTDSPLNNPYATSF